MSDQPLPARRGIDAIALTLCALGLFLAFSLFGTTGPERFAPPAAGANLTAAPVRFRFEIFQSIGESAYLLVAGWLMLAIWRFRRPSWLSFARRTLGNFILVAGFAIVMARYGDSRGGSIGLAGLNALDRNLTPFAGMILLAFGLSLGLFLAAELVLRLLVRVSVGIVRNTFALIEWLLLLQASGLDAMALGLRRAARIIGIRLHPERYPAIVAPSHSVIVAAADASIAITHHLDPRLVGAPVRERPPTLLNFPRSEARKEDTTPIPERPYDLPSLDLLDEPTPVVVENLEQKLMDVASRLEKACADFGLIVKVVGIHTGPVITQYEIALDTGMRVSKITSLGDDLALHLKVSSVRIVAPIPGKNTVGIEVPNEHRSMVRMKELVTAGAGKIAKMKLPLFFGKDSEGRPLIHDLADMPHLLVAGRTGTGKSVCLNTIILSMLLTRRPDECRMIMIDPKQVELAEYGRLPHLMHPVVTDNKKAEAILMWGVDKMEERYEILRRARVRNIASYNDLPYEEILRRVNPVDDDEQQRVPARMPYIVIIVDEVGDLMMAMKKEVEGHIIRLAQKSRAAGIHLILTTQRPTVDIITGLIKSNMPARICFQVADRSNSRVVLDEMGAEKLLGKGDMLFLQPNTSTIIRAQGTYASDEEITRIVGKLEVENPTYDSELLRLEDHAAGPGKGGLMEVIRKRDELYEQAIEIVVREGRGSVSLLQRALGIGYGRAARLVDFMAEDGIVGNYNGAQAREVLFKPEQWDELKGGGTMPLAESA